MNEIYFVVDVETDGPIPGVNSMLSIGCAAVTLTDYNYRMSTPGYLKSTFKGDSLEIVGTYGINLDPLEGAVQDKATMEWWDARPEVWEKHRVSPVDPESAIIQFTNWVNELSVSFKRTPIFVAYPVGFDFTFVSWYMHKFMGNCIFERNTIDIRSLKMGKGYSYKDSKINFDFEHEAVEDAIDQAYAFIELIEEPKWSEENFAHNLECMIIASKDLVNLLSREFRTSESIVNNWSKGNILPSSSIRQRIIEFAEAHKNNLC